jgi:hypothetical protein
LKKSKPNYYINEPEDRNVSMYLFPNWPEETGGIPGKENNSVKDNNIQTEIDPLNSEQEYALKKQV